MSTRHRQMLGAVCGLLLFFALGTATSWAANPVYVDDDFNSGTPGWGVDHFATIQNGINAVDIGGTVYVAAGTYAERVTIGKSLNLYGAQDGVDPTQTGARTNPALESTIDITGLAVANPNVAVEIPSGVTNVSLRGFTIKGSPTSHYADECVVRLWDDNVTIRDNIMDGYFGVLDKGNDYRTIERNVVTVNKTGVTVQPNPASNVTISGNKIVKGASPASDAQAIYMTGVSTATVSGNIASGFSGSNGVGGSNLTNVTVSGNTFTGNRKGVNFWGTTTFITISNNDLSNSVLQGINVKGQDISISGNVIQNAGDAAVAVDYHVIATQRVKLSDNDLSGATNYGLWVNTSTVTETVDASGNWWGSNDAAAVRSEANNGSGADYTPWLHAGTNGGGGPGFQGDFSILDVDDDSPQAGTVDRIREAVALSSGSTINLMAGTYTNTAQVVIGKDIAMVGAGSGSTTINKSFDTGNSGDARGWFLVQAGYDFDLGGVTLDGAGKLVHQAIRNKGEGSADDVVFTDIKYNPSGPDYAGVAIAAFGTGPVDVTGCVFSEIGRVGVLYFGSGVATSLFTGNTYTGKGAGNWLDYALDISAGAVVTVDDCDVSACRGVASSDGSTSAGIMVTTFYGAGTTATVTHCELTDNTTGIEVGYDASDASVVEAHYNSIYGNGTGVYSTNSSVDALSNWWGDATGPYHATLNPGGLGNQVSDNVLFDPWMGGTNEVSVVPDSATTNCTTPVTYTFYMTQAGPSADIRGYDLKFAVDTTIVKVISPAADILEGTYLESVASAAFYAIGYGGGVYGVSSAILGGNVGATGNGDLFTVTLYPQAAGLSSIAITSLKVRDLDNNPLPASFVGGQVRVDCGVPTMEAIAEAENACYNAAPTLANFGFDDDFNLDRAEYQIDALGWNVIFSGIDAASWDNDGWVLPGFAGLGEGAHTVYFRVKDDAGNWNGEGSPQPNLYSWSFVKDTMAPAPPTSFVALPGHNKVHLTWTNPTGDASWVGIEIRRVAWGDYPQYGTPGLPAPSYPADHTGGTLVTQTALAAYDDSPLTPRDIYYYAAFSYDCAGNYSATTAGSKDRSTSYWLGDISPVGPPSGDGSMDLTDLALFSLMFAKPQGSPSWNAEADFGPTDDHGRFGIPMPDDVVDFEDLMILAMNYGKVSPLGTSGGLIALSDAVPLRERVSLRMVLISREDGKATYAVVMENKAEVLKGFSLTVAYGAGNALDGVTASRDLGGKASEHFFGVIERENGVVEICAAALGVNVPFDYSGEVARVVVREATEGAVQLRTVDLRDLNNNKDEVTLPGEVGDTPFIPATTALMQNHPNPFNPTTTIAFDVAVAGDVRIEVYDVSGTLVRTLVNGEKGVGRHVTIWDGRDGAGNQVHTGVYFCRMTAPGYTSQAKKMLLLK